MERWLVSWVGKNDLNAMTGGPRGPIASAVRYDHGFAKVWLLNNFPIEQGDRYRQWLQDGVACDVELHQVELISPTHYGEIYEQVSDFLADLKLLSPAVELTFHLSPGTPAMIAIWIILAKTRFPARLIQTSVERGLETADFLFDLASDFLPEYLRRSEARITRLQSPAVVPPEFAAVIHGSDVMRHQITLARRMAEFEVPILVLGQTGTGKELFAKAIHAASRRRERPFIAVNCGAISRELANSELFGHMKGAFTGADRHHAGFFTAANGGTLFLDEVGDLALDSQVRLLRVLQEKELTPVGDTRAVPVNVRIIAATHKDLAAEVVAGKFRQDLFQRLAVGILNIPPLRERGQDIRMLVDYFLGQINLDAAGTPEAQSKTLSAHAVALLLKHSWPGNIRELYGTLFRAAIWSTSSEIGAEDVEAALLPSGAPASEAVLNHSLGHGFNILDLLADVERHYLMRAHEQSPSNRTAASELLGYNNYQQMNRRRKALGMISDEE
ncbi:Regulator of RNA terminal phosphate cyclase [Janthinobacterium sp. TND4EL3]|uniref:RNA repair transcriptional activator RtcR family protein n=1 Tax=Janthinobacterium sp. TND4EL3 TaxID=1907311 RepID=UPI0009550D22|nr:RNA repair transcriptional activator RtcR family protein [Janthinobacterium sp. TND4EL3]SIQ71790.1 Regulator of RNA terminal phosphate cyclase [Janthinobacterium sp. TND4EL3]